MARRREKDIVEFKALQTEPKAREAEELDRASQAFLLAKHRDQPLTRSTMALHFQNSVLTLTWPKCPPSACSFFSKMP